jgi:hypothetical protein
MTQRFARNKSSTTRRCWGDILNFSIELFRNYKSLLFNKVGIIYQAMLAIHQSLSMQIVVEYEQYNLYQGYIDTTIGWIGLILNLP